MATKKSRKADEEPAFEPRTRYGRPDTTYAYNDSYHGLVVLRTDESGAVETRSVAEDDIADRLHLTDKPEAIASPDEPAPQPATPSTQE